MYKCVRILFSHIAQKDFLTDVVQKNARALSIEGYAQADASGGAKIVAYGRKEAIDGLVDILYHEADAHAIQDIEVEAFSKDRDFRGVFRIIE